MPRLLAAALTLGAVAWAAALLGAAGSGRTPAASAAIHRLASGICHQRPERSFTLNGTQLPVCARCAALYISGALAAAAAWLGRRQAPSHPRAVVLLAALPTALTIPIEWLGVSPLSNMMRAAAAVPLGAAAGWIFVRVLRSES